MGITLNRDQILQILYEMALVTGGETHVEPLILKTLQRLLYHTSFSCGVFISGVDEVESGKHEYILEQVVGCGKLIKSKGSILSLSEKYALNNKSGLITDTEFISSLVGKELSYKTALRLPINESEEFILFCKNQPDVKLSFERIFEPVLTNFGKTLTLCRNNEKHTFLLEQEIAERKKVEVTLRESEIRHRTIFESTVDGIINIDDKGIIESLNPAIEKLFNYTADELIGKNIAVLMPEPFASQHDLFVKKLVQTGKNTILGKDRELAARKKDGTIFPVEIGLDLMFIEGKRMFTGVIRDITDRKEAENQIVNAKEEAERASRAKTDFLSSMSHELRTPLNAVLGFAQLMELDLSLTDETKDYINEILTAGNHLLGLINEVLDLTQIESGHVDLMPEVVNLNQLVKECISLIEPIAQKNNIHIKNTLMNEDFVLRGDKTRIKQVIINLLSNAVKYNNENGQVIISTKLVNDKFYRISIKDTGYGIKAEDITGLFEAFNRLDAKGSAIEGTGIGLVITKKLVNLMGGKIDVESQYGTGSTFWIDMPKELIPHTEFNETIHEEIDTTNPDEIYDYKVLYIEDNPANIKLISKLFATKSKVDFFTAHTPNLGLELAEIKLPDLILLDINLPDMDGFKVLDTLRNNNKTSNIPVIAISANSLPSDLNKAKQAGFDDYIIKPIDVENFNTSVNQLLEKA